MPNLIELFNQSLAKVTPPDKVCVEVIRADRHETLTFRQLKARSEIFATWLLRESGLGPRRQGRDREQEPGRLGRRVLGRRFWPGWSRF